MVNVRGTGAPRLLVVCIALLAIACSGPTASPSPAGTPAPEGSASPIAVLPTTTATTNPPMTETPAPTSTPRTELTYASSSPQMWANRFVMRIAVGDLNVRDRPSTSAASNGKAPKGGLFMMWDWPVTANGYTWYYGWTLLTSVPGVVPDLPTAMSTGYDEVLTGWIATGTEDTPFLIPIAPRCPSTRDVLNVGAMLDSERVACFGSETLELEGRFSCDDCSGEIYAGTFEPEWLADPRELYSLSVEGEDALPVKVHFAPEGPAVPEEGALVRVRGHFSDGRAATCRITVAIQDGGSKAIANEAAEQWCRARFVVESYEVVG